jgi:hypothetical protein
MCQFVNVKNVGIDGLLRMERLPDARAENAGRLIGTQGYSLQVTRYIRTNSPEHLRIRYIMLRPANA